MLIYPCRLAFLGAMSFENLWLMHTYHIVGKFLKAKFSRISIQSVFRKLNFGLFYISVAKNILLMSVATWYMATRVPLVTAWKLIIINATNALEIFELHFYWYINHRPCIKKYSRYHSVSKKMGIYMACNHGSCGELSIKTLIGHTLHASYYINALWLVLVF